jgi:hypothetical protein
VLHTLQVAECGADLAELFGAMQHNPRLPTSLRVLDVSHNALTDDAAVRLRPLLAASSALEVRGTSRGKGSFEG